ncbi:mitochondrial import receptor subunit OR translocase-domain-containing protein [Coniella lustricola]|uniref:Mitochondrial import receptor subunit OR translocase-domain-containing protein n=1 Tax=Coniella lustricola TaxID=2025994 RepID=A0A2T2ZT81_9PEZI|nr:mitochondrial import receptor subunit OR translocase-domain-containing protein [Coniella lustricola]
MYPAARCPTCQVLCFYCTQSTTTTTITTTCRQLPKSALSKPAPILSRTPSKQPLNMFGGFQMPQVSPEELRAAEAQANYTVQQGVAAAVALYLSPFFIDAVSKIF